MNFSSTLILAFVGLILGHGLPGAIVGAVIGFVIDSLRQSQRYRAAPQMDGLYGPLFALLGAVAKSDGRVSEAEIAVAERMMTRMGLIDEQRRQAIASFNRGKQPEFDVTPAIDGLRQWVGMRRDHPILLTVPETLYLKCLILRVQ